MIQDLYAIEYRHGVLKNGMQAHQLPTKTLKGSKITPAVRYEFLETNILNCGGFYGDSADADPVQYEHLKLILTDDTVEIIFINRERALANSGDDKIERIHRFLSCLESESGV